MSVSSELHPSCRACVRARFPGERLLELVFALVVMRVGQCRTLLNVTLSKAEGFYLRCLNRGRPSIPVFRGLEPLLGIESWVTTDLATVGYTRLLAAARECPSGSLTHDYDAGSGRC